VLANTARELGKVCHMGNLRVATAGLDLMRRPCERRTSRSRRSDWRPPAAGDPTDVRLLDQPGRRRRGGCKRARHRSVSRPPGRCWLEPAWPWITSRASTGASCCTPDRRSTGPHGGAAAPRDHRRVPARGMGHRSSRRRRPPGAWRRRDRAGALTRGRRSDDRVISPSMAVWIVRDEESGVEAWSPFCDGPGDAFWLGVGATRRSAVSGRSRRRSRRGSRRRSPPEDPSTSSGCAPRRLRWATTVTCDTRRPPCC